MEQKKVVLDGSITQEKMLDLYWNHFELHSNQRMQMINFYITIEVVLIGAFFTLKMQKIQIEWAMIIVSLAIPFISLIFFLLDYRTKNIVKKAENCIKKIEASFWDDKMLNSMGLFTLVDSETSKRWFRNTYSRVYWLQFAVVSIVGLLLLYSVIN